jgi:hypothetical protein
MKKYGDVVVMVLGDQIANALVVQSVPQADGEHLVVFYLDPAHEATAMGGQSVDAAIKKDFVTPLTEGKKFGWKDLPESVLPTGYGPEEVDGKHGPLLVDFDDLFALSNTVGTIAPNMEISPSGTIISANTLLQEILLRKPAPVLPTGGAPSEEAGEQKVLPSMTVIQFGLGKVVSTVGKSDGFPAVVIEPASPTGEVGADASGNALQDVILAGAVILEFHGDSGAGVLVEDIVKATGLKLEAPEPSPNFEAAVALIEQQATIIKTHRQKIADLEAELEGVKTELATTTEGIDKQLQGIADATAAKEAAPEATENPTSTGPTPDGPTANPSETSTSEVGSLNPSPSPESHSSDSPQESATSE